MLLWVCSSVTLVVCRVRSDLQDHVIMLLRKMMYRQDVSGRWASSKPSVCSALCSMVHSGQVFAGQACRANRLKRLQGWMSLSAPLHFAQAQRII